MSANRCNEGFVVQQKLLPYVHPKLSASAVLIGDDFASKLERVVKRSEKVLELETTNIEEER
jgi:hypothetical protein